MIKAVATCLVGIWMVSTTLGTAQVSSFPAPPPLASREQPADQSQSTGQSTNSSSAAAPQAAGTNPSSSDTEPSGTATPALNIPITAATLSSMTALDDKVALEPGDRISFRVVEDRDEAVPRIVTDTGEVDFPYVGRVKVEGLTCHQVAVELKKLLEVDYYKRATVIVGLDVIANNDDPSKRIKVAWVVGQVRRVGSLELSKDHPMTVSQIIMLAGGFGDFADQRRVKLIHRTALSPIPTANEPPPDGKDAPDAQIVDVKAVFDGHSTVDPVVQPDDYIIVPKRLVNF
jgi:protein involved in polysaccharide export with SLBB domain